MNQKTFDFTSMKKSIQKTEETFSERLRRIAKEDLENRPRCFVKNNKQVKWSELTSYLKKKAIISYLKIDDNQLYKYKIKNVKYDGINNKIIKLELYN